MRRLLSALIVLLAASAIAQAAETEVPGPVMLRAKVVVEGPMVQLGDLFDGLDERAATPIARSPAPGKRVQVSPRWLAAVAKAYGLPWRPSSPLDSTVVERASQVISARRIEEEMLAALTRRGVTGNISIVLDDPALRLYLPVDVEPSMVITGLSHDPNTGRFITHITVPAGGSPILRATVTGRAVATTELPVLRRQVAPGEIIRRDDIEWRRLRADRVPRSAIRDLDNILGKSPRRPLQAGKAILGGELREPVIVARNSLVTIRLETPRMILTAQGRSLESGARGDVIRVRNTQSNQVISAGVVGSGTVAVVPGAMGQIK